MTSDPKVLWNSGHIYHEYDFKLFFAPIAPKVYFPWKLIILIEKSISFKPIWRPFQFHGEHWVPEQSSRSYFEAPPALPAVVGYVYFDYSSWCLPAEGCWGPPTLSLIILRMSCPSSVTAVLEDHVRCHDALPKGVWIYRYNVTVQHCVFLRSVPLGKVSVRHLVMGERFGFILDCDQDTQEKHYNDQQHIIE